MLCSFFQTSLVDCTVEVVGSDRHFGVAVDQVDDHTDDDTNDAAAKATSKGSKATI